MFEGKYNRLQDGFENAPFFEFVEGDEGEVGDFGKEFFEGFK